MVKVTPSSVKNLGTGIAGIGLLGLSFFVLTYLQFYDDIGILEKKGNNLDSNGAVLSTDDMPLGLLLQGEMLGSALLVVGGLFGIFGAMNKSTRSGIFIAVLLALAGFGATGLFRVLTLWGEAEGQCGYIGDPKVHGQVGDYIKACPTTRHANQGPTSTGGFWNATHIEPTLHSDCIFWFWDNTFTLESALISASGSNGTGAGVTIEPAGKAALQAEMIENMDWTQKHMYGYFAIDSPCDSGLGATDCLPDGRTVFEAIETKARLSDKYGVAIANELPGTAGNKLTPDISFCYYWGCSRECNPDRYRINRLLLFSSFAMGGFAFIFAGVAGTYMLGTTEGYLDDGVAVARAEAADAFDIEKSELNNKWKPMAVTNATVVRSRIKKSRELRF
jgi:hypothetical protein